MRSVVEHLTKCTYELLAEREPGSYVDLEDHLGGRATEADVAARDRMANEARLLRPMAIFVSEDSNRPAAIPYPDPSKPAEVFLADPCDGSRQFAQLGFGWAPCVSHHTHRPGEWWVLDAAAITVSGKTATWADDGWLVGVGGNTDDSTDLRQYTTRAKVRIPPCIAVGASSNSGIPLLTKLMSVADPEVDRDARGEDRCLRVWNTAGNPITPGLLRSHTMVAVQLRWSTQWDTLFAFFASAGLLDVYPLVWDAKGTQLPVDKDGRPQKLNEDERRLWWGRPRWAPFERKCIPPIVVGPDEPYTHEVYEIVRSSDYIEIERPVDSEEHRSQFEVAMQRDINDLQAAKDSRLPSPG